MSLNGEILPLPSGDVITLNATLARRLALSHNQISSLPSRFSECTSLRYLNIRANNIRDFPMSVSENSWQMVGTHLTAPALRPTVTGDSRSRAKPDPGSPTRHSEVDIPQSLLGPQELDKRASNMSRRDGVIAGAQVRRQSASVPSQRSPATTSADATKRAVRKRVGGHGNSHHRASQAVSQAV